MNTMPHPLTSKKISYRQRDPLPGSSSRSWRSEPARFNPINAYDPRRPYAWSALLTASAFNRLGWYASIPGNRAYCYAELAVSSLAVADTIASTHCAYPVDLDGLVKYQDDNIPANVHPSQY